MIYEINYKGKFIEIYKFVKDTISSGEFEVPYSAIFAPQVNRIFGQHGMVCHKRDYVMDIEIYENDYKIGVLRNSFPHDMNFKTLSFRYDFFDRIQKSEHHKNLHIKKYGYDRTRRNK